MHEHITPEVLATEAVMTLAAFGGVVVLVEGPSDKLIFEDILPAEYFRVIHCVNKGIAVEAMLILEATDALAANKKARVIALVDSDFDRPLGISALPRSFQTDYHDLDVMLIWSPAFDRWMRQYGLEEKVAAFGGVDAVRSKLTELCEFIGAMRLFAIKASLAVNFDSLRYETYVEKRTLSVNRFGLCQGIWNVNREAFRGLSLANFLAGVERELQDFSGDTRDLVQGHDIVNVLGIMMRFALASMEAKTTEEQCIAPALRLAYRPGDWFNSAMGREFLAYLVANELKSPVPSESIVKPTPSSNIA